LIRRNEQGRYLASVSIRSGQASMTQDRLMRFIPCFATADDAAHYARNEAMRYIRSLRASSFRYSFEQE